MLQAMFARRLPPPDRALPRRTMSGLILSYSDASILPVRHKPYDFHEHERRMKRRESDIPSGSHRR